MAAVKLLDHYSEFHSAFHTCKCGSSGTGAMMNNGECTGLGIDKLYPACGERHTFAKFSALVEDDCPDDWPPIG
jgi:hypothetical protein